jgi:hypothetical protein
MKTRSVIAALLLLSGLGVVTARALACGDKFLVTNGGTRYQHSKEPRDAAILIYNSPSSEVQGVLASVSVDKVLRREGYRPTIVTSMADFEKEFGHGGWSLIIAGSSDAQALSGRVHTDNGPALLPVVFNQKGTQLKQMKDMYHVVVNAPVKGQSLLDDIDEALASRPRAQARNARATD